MVQLVGQRCVVCSKPISTILHGRFCQGCSRAVHNTCARPDNLAASRTHCPQCGGNPSIDLAPTWGHGTRAWASSKEPTGKQSTLGVASALLFVLSFLLVILDVYLAADLAPWQQRQIVVLAMMAMSFLGLASGIAGGVKPGRQKGYAIVGAFFNLLVLGWSILLYALVHR